MPNGLISILIIAWGPDSSTMAVASMIMGSSRSRRIRRGGLWSLWNSSLEDVDSGDEWACVVDRNVVLKNIS